MIITGLEMTVRLFDFNSLKEKRRVVKSIVEKMRRRYNVSAAEVDALDSLDKAVIGFAIVSNNNRHNEKVLRNLLNEIDHNYEVEIVYTNWIDY